MDHLPVDNVNGITPCSSVSSAFGREYERGRGLHTESEIAAAAKPLEGAGTGIYFLVKGGRVVYVGQSLCVLARVGTHSTNASRPFDSWSWLSCDRSQLDALERDYITALMPPYNVDWVTKVLRLRAGDREQRPIGDSLAPALPIQLLNDRGYQAVKPRLTDKLIATLQCPENRKDMIVFDGKGTGLGIRVTANRKKVFLFQYRSGSKVHRVRLGEWPGLTATQAQLLAKARRREVYSALMA
jgi:hypothetical protein